MAELEPQMTVTASRNHLAMDVSPVESAVDWNYLKHHSSARIETGLRYKLAVKHGKSSQTGMVFRGVP